MNASACTELFRIGESTIASIKNAALRTYSQRYVDIEADLIEQIRAMGVDVAERRVSPLLAFAHEAAADSGLTVRNDDRSVCRGYLSPACGTCRAGIGTRTFFLNTRCNRTCFFCFNPNQREYADRAHMKHDIVAELEEVAAAGEVLDDIALTGGEPLLFPDEVISFFARAHELFPRAYTRLYTNGDFADDGILSALGEAGLDEIRFSVKQDDPAAGYAQDPVVSRVSAAKRHIPHAMVEMPALPHDETNMIALLDALDAAGCDGINLLELCFPFYNWEEYARRGYRVKNPPFRVPYAYEYAGGLPIVGSEEVCLALLAHAEHAKLRMGVHYCSLENKFTSQINLQNAAHASAAQTCALSRRDFFPKSCKAFGEEAARIAGALADARAPVHQYALHAAAKDNPQYVEFHPALASIAAAALPDAEIAICYHVIEEHEGALALRELALDCVRAADFEPVRDL